MQNDRLGALSAWNEVGEPRLDLVRIDGLTRTRHRVVERLLNARTDEVLTPGRFMRARRQLASLPSATSTRLEYVPVPSGLAELRAVVAERPLMPTGRWSFAQPGTGRRRYAGSAADNGRTAGRRRGGFRRVAVLAAQDGDGAGIHAPAPWGGVWSFDAFSERAAIQRRTEVPASGQQVLVSRRPIGRRVGCSGRQLRESTSGLRSRRADKSADRFEFVTLDDRLDAAFGLSGWPGSGAFGTLERRHPRSIFDGEAGRRVAGSANFQFATRRTPLDLWWAGDTGHARSTLLGRIRAGRRPAAVERLGRSWGSSVSRRSAGGRSRARSALRLRSSEMSRGQLGATTAGQRAGMWMWARRAPRRCRAFPGLFAANLAKGLADGATAFSVTYHSLNSIIKVSRI